ncbi:hypothetical protein [Trichormus variabilis]|uniref:hypothetical protein n=1 Tax=Anabaena variabilis TaxID=264691 RepID=UPI001689599C|nr:hypothetical protein [Trichormus variabilis]MBD2626518.1 hypothetical protein [Trichormus variabilis FACHB-164]
MPILKSKQVNLIILLLIGIAYFSTMSNLEINNFYKSLIFMMPIQIATVIYVTYRRWSR